MGSCGLHLMSALLKFDHLLAEGKSLSATHEEQLHAEDFRVKVSGDVDVGYGKDEVVERIHGDGHIRRMILVGRAAFHNIFLAVGSERTFSSEFDNAGQRPGLQPLLVSAQPIRIAMKRITPDSIGCIAPRMQNRPHEGFRSSESALPKVISVTLTSVPSHANRVFRIPSLTLTFEQEMKPCANC
jgi:hypothetical protein